MKISTQIFSMALATLLLANTMRVSITYAYYEIDPIGFIEALCVNKDQPELQCNGSCHLKKVSKSQDGDQKTPERLIDFKELILYPNSTMKHTFQQELDTKKESPIAYQNLYAYIELNECFHPPQV